MNRDIREEWTSAIQDYERWMAFEQRKPRTIEVRLYQIAKFSDSVAVGPTKVTPLDIVRYLGKGHWKPRTQNAARAGIRKFFGWAAGPGQLIESNPADSLRPTPVPLAEPHAVSRVALLEGMKAASEPATTLIELIAHVGLKAAEVAELRTVDIKRDSQGVYFVMATRGARQVPLRVPMPLATRLLTYPKGFVFPGRLDGHISSPYVSRLISRALPNMTSEDIRGLLAPQPSEHHHVPRSSRLALSPLLADNSEAQTQLIYIERDLLSDPGAAISQSKNLLETTFKRVLTERDVAYQDRDEVPQLWNLVAVELGLLAVDGNSRARDAVKLTTRNLASLVQGVAESRNSMGNGGHGAEEDRGAQIRHARLVFNATVAISEFLLDSIDG